MLTCPWLCLDLLYHLEYDPAVSGQLLLDAPLCSTNSDDMNYMLLAKAGGRKGSVINSSHHLL